MLTRQTTVRMTAEGLSDNVGARFEKLTTNGVRPFALPVEGLGSGLPGRLRGVPPQCSEIGLTGVGQERTWCCKP